MRLIARTVAAVVAIILGFALVGAAAFTPGSGSPVASRPTAPPIEPTIGSLRPLDPGSGGRADEEIPGTNQDPDPTPTPTPTPDIFASEFGKRGEHVVTVSASGGAYNMQWRDGQTDTSSGSVRRTRTVRGGFPLVQILIFSGSGRSTCVVTIDGVEKDREASKAGTPWVICQA